MFTSIWTLGLLSQPVVVDTCVTKYENGPPDTDVGIIDDVLPTPPVATV